MAAKPRNMISENCFFGSVTVGERGQVVIPAEARKDLGIGAGDHLLVFLHPMGQGLVLTKIDFVQDAIASFQRALATVPSKASPETQEVIA